MAGEVRPPFAVPNGPELPEEGVVDAFLQGAREGYSDNLHIEDEMMLAARMVPVAVRLGPNSLLVRDDVGRAALPGKRAIEKRLQSKGLQVLEADARLGDVAAIQVTGVRGGVWDLWGTDREQAHQDLERSVLGADAAAVQSVGPVQDFGAGMTLDELLDDIKREDEQ